MPALILNPLDVSAGTDLRKIEIARSKLALRHNMRADDRSGSFSTVSAGIVGRFRQVDVRFCP